MRYGWRAFSLFGAGALFGLVASAVLFAPPELQDQPSPWGRWAWDKGAAASPMALAANTAAPSPAVTAATPPVDPVAVAPATALVAETALAASPVVTVGSPPAPKKRKVQKVESAPDTAMAGAGPAPYPVSVAPEFVRPPQDEAPSRGERDGADPSR